MAKKLPPYIQEIDGELWMVEIERDNMKIYYRIKDILYEEQSDIQHVMVLDSYDFGRILVLDGAIQTTELDGHIYNEMITHVPLSIHPNPERVLIIGGGDCGAAREVMKYDTVKQLDMVEIDEVVVKVSKEYLTGVSGNLSDPRVNFIFDDGIKYVKDLENVYDVIIIDSSDPVGPAVQLFEKEFYTNVRRALKDDGLMVCQSESPLFYRSIMERTVRYIGELYPISKVYWASVPTYPGGFWSFTIGSKKYKDIHVKSFDKDTKYINQTILESCFDLPVFLQVK